jgi:hypothetical protein
LEFSVIAKYIIYLTLVVALLFSSGSRWKINRKVLIYLSFSSVWMIGAIYYQYFRAPVQTVDWFLKFSAVSLFPIFLCRSSVDIFKKVIFAILLTNLMVCFYEISVGFLSQWDASINLKEWTRSIAPPPYSQPMGRRIAENIVLYRPHGLFGQVHLSAFANMLLLFLLYFKLKYSKKSETLLTKAAAILSFSVLLLGCTMQYWAIAILFFFLNEKQTGVKLLFCLVGILGIIGGYVSFYGASTAQLNSESSMIRIFMSIPTYLSALSTITFFIGGLTLADVANLNIPLIDLNKLDDIGFVRYILYVGFVGLSLAFIQFLSFSFFCRSKQTQILYLKCLFCCLLSALHVFNMVSLISFAVFIFLPYWLDELIVDNNGGVIIVPEHHNSPTI